MSENVAPQTAGTEGQYGLLKILGIWVAAAAPMAILGWVAHPALAAQSGPLGSAVIRVSLMTVGLIWQFILSMIVVYREEDTYAGRPCGGVFGSKSRAIPRGESLAGGCGSG